MNKKLFALCMFSALNFVTSYSSEKQGAGCQTDKCCSKACDRISSKTGGDRSSCVAACMKSNGLTGISCGSQPSGGGYPSGSDHGQGSSWQGAPKEGDIRNGYRFCRLWDSDNQCYEDHWEPYSTAPIQRGGRN